MINEMNYMEEIEEIGMFKGKFISEMSREELLDFARWAAQEISSMQKKLNDPEVSGFLIKREIYSHAN